MLPEEYQWIAYEFEPEGNSQMLFSIGKELENDGNLEGAATVYDRAFGLSPDSDEIRIARWKLLNRLAVDEHGIKFRYIPGGPFLMGSLDGEDDEKPFHPVWLSPYWIAETPISWTTYCRLFGWTLPPQGYPTEEQQQASEFEEVRFLIYHCNKIRLQYCEDHTQRARDWHSHDPGQTWGSGDQTQTAQELFGNPVRAEPEAAWEYAAKPMVAVGWHEAMKLGEQLSTPKIRYTLPSETQWEKAARGGLIGSRYSWGNAKPTQERCDFGRFRDFVIQPMKALPPNNYGLFAMCGGIWEWTRDYYDREAYDQMDQHDPESTDEGEEFVLRGGSWADCAEVCTVSYRMSRPSSRPKDSRRWSQMTPNVGFRLCRMRNSEEA
jgi:formylglycine-generating enzyme